MSDAVTAQEVVIVRVYEAPRELVWRSWTEPEQLSRWWGPRGWSAPLATIELDVRPGGAFRVLGVCDADGREMLTEATYLEVVAPERLAFEQPSHADGRPGTVGVVTFTELGEGRTEMTFRATVHVADEIRRAMERGMSSAFARLGEQLA